MSHPNVPDQGINTRSEESIDTVTAATRTLAAVLVLVRCLVPGLAHDPVNVTIATLTLRVRLLVHDLPWTEGMMEVVTQAEWSARRLRRNTMLGWRGRRTNASQPRSEGGSRFSEIGIRGILRNHPRMVFGLKACDGFPSFGLNLSRLTLLLVLHAHALHSGRGRMKFVDPELQRR